MKEKGKRGKGLMGRMVRVRNDGGYMIGDLLKGKRKEKEREIVEYGEWGIGEFVKKGSGEGWYKKRILVIEGEDGKVVGKREGELGEC